MSAPAFWPTVRVALAGCALLIAFPACMWALALWVSHVG